MDEFPCDYLEYTSNGPYCNFTKEYISEQCAAICNVTSEEDRDNCLNYCYTPES